MTARYVAVVRNRRTGGTRSRSSLWDVTVNSLPGRTVRVRELRRGRVRSLSFTRRVPRTTESRFCVDVTATAPGARAAHERLCSPVSGAVAPVSPRCAARACATSVVRNPGRD